MLKKIDAPVNTAAKVTLSPNGGDFEKTSYRNSNLEQQCQERLV